MDLRELEYFKVIAQKQNLSKAAEKLYVGQPTLTKYVQRVEAEYGLPLFSHTGRQMQLTFAGERYLYYANRLLAEKRSLDQEMADIRKADAGSVHLGMPPVRCSYVLPLVLPLFRSAYPNVEILVKEDNSSSLDEALQEGRVDLAFFSVYAQKSSLSYEVLQEDQIYVIVQKGHPIGQRALPGEDGILSVRLEWLMNEVFLLQNRSQRQGAYVWQILKDHHLAPKRVQEHSNIPAAVSLAANGFGVTFLSGGLIPYLKRTCDFDHYALLDIRIPIRFAAAWKKGNYLPVYTRDLIRMVRQTTQISS